MQEAAQRCMTRQQPRIEQATLQVIARQLGSPADTPGRISMLASREAQDVQQGRDRRYARGTVASWSDIDKASRRMAVPKRWGYTRRRSAPISGRIPSPSAPPIVCRVHWIRTCPLSINAGWTGGSIPRSGGASWLRKAIRGHRG
jgi:hypothetical protein